MDRVDYVFCGNCNNKTWQKLIEDYYLDMECEIEVISHACITCGMTNYEEGR